MPEKVLFYPAYLSNHAGRRSPFCLGKPCDTAAEAKALAKKEVDDGNASMATVARFGEGKKVLLANYLYPAAVQSAIKRWLDMEAALKDS